ncbi:putative two-component system response regulator [Abditibacterium utsteinense]|uniref:Putative two-component system response regulator n=1 Tax=Abditibacterium utsteinense TaxID=1960156 RepID=A0A2S8SQP8_9BACT|nr:HD domain-containing phosphohydrolase [Abditibacterium utsteinense]PQV63132.1 putative two-component system response regulator [Abditibacterium utsteinense]
MNPILNPLKTNSLDSHIDAARHAARILIVDDEPANVLLLQRILDSAGYSALSNASNGEDALKCCDKEIPDLILLDLMMPVCDGFGVLSGIAPLLVENYLPVLVLTADVSPAAKRRALRAGAKDFLTKPFDATEVLLRVKNLLETHFLTLQLRDQNHHLEARVRVRTMELQNSNRKLELFNAQLQASKLALEESQVEVLHRLAQAAELRDDDTGQHTRRVGEMAARLAAKIGLGESEIEIIRQAAPLHDVGKIGISDTILLKPGKLTPDEFDVMKTHTSIGATLLASGQSPIVRAAESIALTHHERFEGSGYPRGLRGEEIPLEGRILAVVDVFDALTHERPYKKAWPIEAARAEIQAQSGRHFDPQIVAAFLEISFLAS